MKWLLFTALGLQFLVAPLCVAGTTGGDHPGHGVSPAAIHQVSSDIAVPARERHCEYCDAAPGRNLFAAADMVSVPDCIDFSDGLLILSETSGTSAPPISETMPFAYASLDPPSHLWHRGPVSLPHGHVYLRTLRIRL